MIITVDEEEGEVIGFIWNENRKRPPYIKPKVKRKKGEKEEERRIKERGRDMGSIVFFGAGASNGTLNVEPESPPLGPMLYSKLVQAFPNTWGRLPSSLAKKFENFFEDGMDELWQNHSNVVPNLMQDMACFFARYRLDGSQRDYYSRLILDLQQARKLDNYAFSTINYECLIEHALNLAGRKVCYGPEYSTNSDISTLWKIHGSCNFTVKGITARKGDDVDIRYTSDATFHGIGINFIDVTQVPTYCATSALYPCMSLYAPGKPNQMARAMIESMQQNWQSYVSTADKVIVIGASPYPPDTHIWDYFANCPGHLYYVGDEEKFIEWVRNRRVINTYSYLGNEIANCYRNLKAIL